MPSRRQFLKVPAIGLLGAAAHRVALAQPASGAPQAPPGQPPAFGTGTAVGPTISPTTSAEAEKLMQVTYTPAERAQAAANWRVSLASVYERRPGPHKLALEPTLGPATRR